MFSRRSRRSALGLSLLLVVLFGGPWALADTGPQLFHQGSLAHIVSDQQNEPFLLVVWSVECEPCLDELKLLGEMRAQEPGLKLVLIATDGPEQASRMAQLLTRFDMTDVPHWRFAQANSPRLRLSIDPQWFGELPRAYFYQDADTRAAHSGALTRQTLLSWLAYCCRAPSA